MYIFHPVVTISVRFHVGSDANVIHTTLLQFVCVSRNFLVKASGGAGGRENSALPSKRGCWFETCIVRSFGKLELLHLQF